MGMNFGNYNPNRHTVSCLTVRYHVYYALIAGTEVLCLNMHSVLYSPEEVPTLAYLRGRQV
jgi:hypothetical protein